MGGCLIHSRTFRVRSWSSEQNGPHYEVGPDDEGDFESFSWTRWGELQEYCESVGLAAALWPAFLDCVYCIDVPMDELTAKQEPFRRAVEALPPEVIAANPFLARIAGYLGEGEQIAFCG